MQSPAKPYQCNGQNGPTWVTKRPLPGESNGAHLGSQTASTWAVNKPRAVSIYQNTRQKAMWVSPVPGHERRAKLQSANVVNTKTAHLCRARNVSDNVKVLARNRGSKSAECSGAEPFFVGTITMGRENITICFVGTTTMGREDIKICFMFVIAVLSASMAHLLWAWRKKWMLLVWNALSPLPDGRAKEQKTLTSLFAFARGRNAPGCRIL